MMGVLSSGVVQFFNEAKHKMTLRRVPKVMVVTEEHLNRTDKELIRDLRVSTSATAGLSTKRNTDVDVELDAEPPATPRPPPVPPGNPVRNDQPVPDPPRELPPESEALRAQLRELRREHDQLAQLYDQQFDRYNRLQREMDAHNASCPLGRSIYVTHSGRCWHCDANCYHIRRAQYRTFRHCQDCAGR